MIGWNLFKILILSSKEIEIWLDFLNWLKKLENKDDDEFESIWNILSFNVLISNSFNELI